MAKGVTSGAANIHHRHINKAILDAIEVALTNALKSTYDNHLANTSNPHSVTKTQTGLGNVTDNAQVKKRATSTPGNVPAWDGASGDALSDGYSVETTLTGGSGSLPRADAVKTYIDNLLKAADALVFRGFLDCSLNPNYPAADSGDTYKVTVAGKLGGASGISVKPGDIAICSADSTPSGDQATVGTAWAVIPNNMVIGLGLEVALDGTIQVKVSDFCGDGLRISAPNGYTKLHANPDGTTIEINGDKKIAVKSGVFGPPLGFTPENVANKVAAFQITPDDLHYPTEKLVKDGLDGKQAALGFTPENVANRVSAFQVTPDDTHYPTEKLVKDSLDDKQAILGYTPENVAAKRSSFQVTPDDLHYPSEKLVKDALDGKLSTGVTTAAIADSTDKRYCTDAEKAVIGNTSGTNSGNETTTTIGAMINGASEKTTPVDADMFGLMDSVAGNLFKKFSWASLKTALNSLYLGISATAAAATKLITARTIDGQSFDGTANITVIAPGTHAVASATAPVDADEVPGTDSASSYVLKKSTWTQIKAFLKTYFDTLYVPKVRTNTVTSSATPTINTDTTDIFTITALAVAITSMTTNLSGSPVNGQKLIIRFKDDGTGRAITWGASYASRGATLPTTTVASKTMYVGLIYNSTAAVWDCVAVSTEA